MQRLTILLTGALVVAVAGCAPTHPEQRAVNTRIIQSVNDMAIKNAIITQQTLYPYHFITHSASLNKLGQCELAVLAAHYAAHPGTLNVRKGATPPDLYQERLKTVHQALADAGVARDRIELADGMPGGDGMPSEQVLKIVEGRNSPSQPLYYGAGGGGGGVQPPSGQPGGAGGAVDVDVSVINVPVGGQGQ